jgi:hypothetical protein
MAHEAGPSAQASALAPGEAGATHHEVGASAAQRCAALPERQGTAAAPWSKADGRCAACAGPGRPQPTSTLAEDAGPPLAMGAVARDPASSACTHGSPSSVGRGPGSGASSPGGLSTGSGTVASTDAVVLLGLPPLSTRAGVAAAASAAAAGAPEALTNRGVKGRAGAELGRLQQGGAHSGASSPRAGGLLSGGDGDAGPGAVLPGSGACLGGLPAAAPLVVHVLGPGDAYLPVLGAACSGRGLRVRRGMQQPLVLPTLRRAAAMSW